jgi:hypothetical protein
MSSPTARAPSTVPRIIASLWSWFVPDPVERGVLVSAVTPSTEDVPKADGDRVVGVSDDMCEEVAELECGVEVEAEDEVEDETAEVSELVDGVYVVVVVGDSDVVEASTAEEESVAPWVAAEATEDSI